MCVLGNAVCARWSNGLAAGLVPERPTHTRRTPHVTSRPAGTSGEHGTNERPPQSLFAPPKPRLDTVPRLRRVQVHQYEYHFEPAA